MLCIRLPAADFVAQGMGLAIISTAMQTFVKIEVQILLELLHTHLRAGITDIFSTIEDEEAPVSH